MRCELVEAGRRHSRRTRNDAPLNARCSKSSKTRLSAAVAAASGCDRRVPWRHFNESLPQRQLRPRPLTSSSMADINRYQCGRAARNHIEPPTTTWTSCERPIAHWNNRFDQKLQIITMPPPAALLIVPPPSDNDRPLQTSSCPVAQRSAAAAAARCGCRATAHQPIGIR